MLDKTQKIHIIGAGGVGLSAAGKFLVLKGKEVTGTDIKATELTEEFESTGALVKIGHAPELVTKTTDLVIFSSAVPEDDPERVRAKELGVRQLSYFEFLGELSKNYTTIVVTGTNGKSTTTAMLGKILITAGLDPTIFVGTQVPGFEYKNLQVGSSDLLLVEGCEYQANMLHLNPDMIVLTNIEEDHLDFYRDLDHIRTTFQGFVDKLPPKDGLLIRNTNDPESMKLEANRIVSYGFETEAHVVGSNRMTESGKQSFDLTHAHEELGTVELMMPGRFNVENALAAMTVALKLGIDFKTIVKGLKNFSGIWRRFEFVGELAGAPIISDYGHHPVAIADTLKAAREFYPDKKILLCFQPHQHARTIELFDEFVPSFDAADQLIVAEIYDVAGRDEEREEISSQKLVEAINDRGQAKAEYAKDLVEAEQMVRDLAGPDDVILIMGAGDIDEVARKL